MQIPRSLRMWQTLCGKLWPVVRYPNIWHPYCENMIFNPFITPTVVVLVRLSTLTKLYCCSNPTVCDQPWILHKSVPTLDHYFSVTSCCNNGSIRLISHLEIYSFSSVVMLGQKILSCALLMHPSVPIRIACIDAIISLCIYIIAAGMITRFPLNTISSYTTNLAQKSCKYSLPCHIDLILCPATLNGFT